MNSDAAFAVVVPFFNEERNVGIVSSELRRVVEGALGGGEVILVDDGSSDQTGAKLDEIARDWPACRVFHLRQNSGQSAALLFGFSQTNAPILITLDGDGQNDPDDILKLLARLDGVDMVVGARMERQDSWMRRKISRLANRVRSKWLGDGLSDAGCALKVFRREVVSAFIPIRTLYSFMPSLAVAAGFRVTEVPVKHRQRAHGDSKYSVRSFLIRPIIDCIGVHWFRSRRCRTFPSQADALLDPLCAD
jgi:dolichol-phosphate mannosyltransferase